MNESKPVILISDDPLSSEMLETLRQRGGAEVVSVREAHDRGLIVNDFSDLEERAAALGDTPPDPALVDSPTGRDPNRTRTLGRTLGSRSLMIAAALLGAGGGVAMASTGAAGENYNPNTGRNRSSRLTTRLAEERERQRTLEAARRAGVSKTFAEAYVRPASEADRIAIEKAEAKRAMRAAKRAKVAK